MLPTWMRRLLKSLGARVALWPRLAALSFLLVLNISAAAQEAIDNPEFAALVDRPISAIGLEGLKRVTESEARNNIRAALGDPFNPDVIKADLSRLNRLGHFKNVDATAELQADGS